MKLPINSFRSSAGRGEANFALRFLINKMCINTYFPFFRLPGTFEEVFHKSQSLRADEFHSRHKIDLEWQLA